MTFKKVHYGTLGRPETWGIDYKKCKVETPGGVVLSIPQLIEWFRYVKISGEEYYKRSEAARLRP